MRKGRCGATRRDEMEGITLHQNHLEGEVAHMSTEAATNPATAKMSRGKKIWITVGSIIAALIVIVLIYAFAITRSGFWFISTMLPDSEEKQVAFSSAAETTQAIADEGFVLMQNDDDLLPLTTTAEKPAGINVFGMRGVQLVFNAGGSSASNVDEAVRLEDALRDGGFELNDDLLNLYYNYSKSGDVSIQETDAPANYSSSEIVDESGEGGDNVIVDEVPSGALTGADLYDDGRSMLEHAEEFSDVAMVVVGRGGGEMQDFTAAELQLSADEAELVDDVATTFDDVILVINSANTLELDFLEQYPSIKSVVWIGYPGQMGVNSLARILNGTVNPSGHLADTWLKDNLASPAAHNYLETAADGTWEADSFKYADAPEGSGYFTQYSEGIYVGYRYFETRNDTDADYDYDADVMFPFGHGLSYTSFEQQLISLDENDGEISIRVGVHNAGEVAGKDVIQVYYNPPYTGAIEKSTVNLVAYEKTNILEPGATETYTLTFPVEDMASYDYQDAAAWVLEAGDYAVSIREDAHSEIAAQTWSLADTIVYHEDVDGARASDQATATNLFDAALGVDDYLTREWDETSRAFTGPQEADFTAPQEVLDAIAGFTPPTDAELGLTAADMPDIGQELDETISFEDMVDVESDDPKWDEFVSQLNLDELSALSGNGAWQINGVERLGVPRTLTPDGTTTIGSSIYSGAIMGVDAKGVTYPNPSVVSSSWNDDIAKLMGTSIGTEAQASGFAGWYAPAMNTHRTPFNGRNFEYYSEDGVLAGATAAGVISSARDMGLITYMKHFAVNDREKNTRSYLFNWSNEQALREIYLKPFELAVKDGGSLGAMSSFNFIGPVWAGGDQALLTDLLREEWGFEGVVITDANIYSFMDVVQMSYAGGNMSLDVMVSWTGGEGQGALLKDAAESDVTRIGMTRNLVSSAKQILFAVAQTWPVIGTDAD